MEREQQESDEDSDDEIEFGKINFRQADDQEEKKQIETYAQILEEIDRDIYSNPHHKKQGKDKKDKINKPAKPVAPLVESLNEVRHNKYEEDQLSR